MRLGIVAVILWALTAAAHAAPPMLLEVWVGDRTDNQSVPLTADGDRLLMDEADYAALKLSLPVRAVDGKIDLNAIKGLSATIDQVDQRLMLTVWTAALPKQVFDMRAADAPPAMEAGTDAGSGAILHYGLSGTASNLGVLGRTIGAGGDFGLDVFTPTALYRNSGFVTGGSGGWQGVRLETSLVRANPDRLTHVTFGDAISTTPDWGRAVRFAGIEYATDFSLRPGLVTQPLPSFFGQSAVPATVDVFNGAVQVYRQQVDAGPFSLRNLPVVTGGGSATIVTTDVLGRQTMQTISLFTDLGMLAPGLDDYAFNAGFLRRGYGLQSFAYNAPMVSANWRRGVTNFLTTQLHGEASEHLGLLGGGAELGFGIGSVSADYAASKSLKGFGGLVSGSVQMMHGDYSLFAHAMLADPNYRDLASLDGNFAPPRQRYQLGASANFHTWGVLGVSWLENKNPRDVSRQFLTTSWSMTLRNQAFLSLTGLRDFRDNSLSFQLSLSVPLDNNVMAGTTSDVADGHASGQAIYARPADPDGGVGYRMIAGSEMDGHILGNVTYIGRSVGLDGGVAVQNGEVGVQGNADGALVLLGGNLYTAHNPGNAVALVETGQRDVRVYVENREIGRSDKDGRVLVTGLNPYAPNHISIDPRDYPFEMEVEKTDIVVAPRQHGGAVASFVPAHHQTVTLQVVADGGPVPMGTKVLMDGETAPLFVGHDGRFEVADFKGSRGATVTMNGRECRIHVPSDPGDAPLACLREVARAD